jgi:hypothetical protein
LSVEIQHRGHNFVNNVSVQLDNSDTGMEAEGVGSGGEAAAAADSYCIFEIILHNY